MFKDSWPAKRLGTKRLECVLTLRAGKVVYERGVRAAGAQDTKVYDLLFKHGRLGDQHGEVDLGIVGNRIARISRGLNATHARVVIEAEGFELAPAGLAEGGIADITLREAGRVIMTLRNGKIITDDYGLSIPDISRAGAYSNFK